MKKKQINPESSWGPKELPDGSLDWITPNYDLHIEEGCGEYAVFVFDSRIKDNGNDEAFVEAQEFDFWYEV